MASATSNEVLDSLGTRTRTKTARYPSSEFVDGKGLSPEAVSVVNKRKHGAGAKRFEGSCLSMSQPNINSVPQFNTQIRRNGDKKDESSDDDDSSDDSSDDEGSSDDKSEEEEN